MYDQENGGFDHQTSNLHEGSGLLVHEGHDEDGFSQTHLPNCNTNPSFSIEDHQQQQQEVNAISAMEMELQINQLNMEMEQCYNAANNEIQQIVQEMSSFNGGSGGDDHHHHHYNVQNGHFTTTETLPYPTTTPHHDLLNIFPFPNLLPNSSSSISFSNPAHQKSSSFLASLGLLQVGDLNNNNNNPTGPDMGSSAALASVVYDHPLLPLNLPPHVQPPLLRDLFHSLPHGGNNNNYTTLGGSRSINGSLFSGGVDERDIGAALYHQNGENGVFEFTAGGGGEMDCLGNKNRDGNNKDTKHFATERHRRVLLNDKYQALRKLVANPTKNDRASIVGDAIEYINELKRSVAELKLLVEKKRCTRERLKRLKTEDHDHHHHANNNNNNNIEGNNDHQSNKSPTLDHMDHPCNGSTLRSSWLHRKSKNTEVDVRIIDDEVTVKLVQQKRINCLLFVSKVLDELQLDLHHVAGGLIGDYYSFLFNSKICEGSIVYASAIANKLIEVVDKHYAAIPPTNSY